MSSKVLEMCQISYSDSISCQYEFVGKSWGFSIFRTPNLRATEKFLNSMEIEKGPHGFPIIMENIYRWFPYIFLYIYIFGLGDI
jgi:hypothetical protein